MTFDRWVRAWRDGGFEALVPAAREGVPRRTPEGCWSWRSRSSARAPERTAAQIVRIIREPEGRSRSARTVQRHFAAPGCRARAGRRSSLGRFEAERPNELWIGDALHGPLIADRKAILFCFIDDHSRLLPGIGGRRARTC